MMTRNRQFWMVQIGAWIGYGIENFLSGIGYGRPLDYYKLAVFDALCGLGFTLLIPYGLKHSWNCPLRSRLWVGGGGLASTSVAYAHAWALALSQI